jgi:uncharacterized protein (TIGR00251 family)
MIEVRDIPGGASFSVRVQPRAGRDEIAGEWQGALRVKLSAPPVDDKANEALRRLLAERLNVPISVIRISQGRQSRNKRVQIEGRSTAQVFRMLEALAGQAR